MKKIVTLFALQVFVFAAVGAQDAKANTSQDIKEKIAAAQRQPQTAQRAAVADVLLVHSRRWTSGHPNIPAHYTLGPLPVIRSKD